MVRLTTTDGELYFINLLSMGFVAQVATSANRRWKRLGAAGYGVAVVLETLGLAPRRVRMRVDGGRDVGARHHLRVVLQQPLHRRNDDDGAVRRYGDGQLDVIVAGAMGRWTLLARVPAHLLGHARAPAGAQLLARAQVEFDVPDSRSI